MPPPLYRGSQLSDAEVEDLHALSVGMFRVRISLRRIRYGPDSGRQHVHIHIPSPGTVDITATVGTRTVTQRLDAR